MTRRTLAVLAVLAALAGCTPGARPSAAASPAASTDAQRVLELGRRFAQCARDHGYPNFPDPELHGDRLSFPVVDGVDTKQQSGTIAEIPACKAVADQLQGLSQRAQNTAPPSAADMVKLREFAKCMRAHGLPEWPDPKTDGTFPITGTPLEAEGRSERFLSGLDACKNLYDRRIVTS